MLRDFLNLSISILILSFVSVVRYHMTMKTSQMGRIPNVTCDLCGEAMYRRPAVLKMNAGKFCSRTCRNRVHPSIGPRPGAGRKGELNPAWKGGVTYFKTKGNYTGVVYVRAPERVRPMARKDGYIMQHRLVMAEMCGRLLSRTEVVNHIDHKPGNNDLSNLELWPTNADHKRGEVGRCVSGVANRLFLQD